MSTQNSLRSASFFADNGVNNHGHQTGNNTVAPPAQGGGQQTRNLNDILASLPADNDFVELKFRAYPEPHCLSWSEFEEDERKSIENKDVIACRFRFDLMIPRGAASAYSQIVVKGEVKKPFQTADVYCGPTNFEIPVTDKAGTVNSPGRMARADNFQWTLYGHILRPLPHSPNDQEFKLMVRLPTANKEPVKLKITLEGWPKPWLAPWLIGTQSRTWCYPSSACP